MVFLAGKDENNKTIYLEEDGSKHAHKTQQHQMQQQAQGSLDNSSDRTNCDKNIERQT